MPPPHACTACNRALDYCTLRSDEKQMFGLSMMLGTKIPFLRLAASDTFCSKMCVEALQRASLLAPDINAALVTTRDLHTVVSQPPPGAGPADHEGVVAALDFAV